MACITTIKNATKIKSQNWNCLLMEGVILTDLSHYLYLAKSRPTAHFRSKLDCTFLRYKARRRSWTWKIYLKSRKNPKSTNCALFCEPVILGKSLLISPHTCKEDGIRVKEGQNSTLTLNEWSKTWAFRFWKPKRIINMIDWSSFSQDILWCWIATQVSFWRELLNIYKWGDLFPQLRLSAGWVNDYLLYIDPHIMKECRTEQKNCTFDYSLQFCSDIW